MAKIIYNYKLAKEMHRQLLAAEEEAEEEYHNNEQYVSKDDESDGKKVRAEYYSKLRGFSSKWAEMHSIMLRKKERCMLTNLQHRRLTGGNKMLTMSVNLHLDNGSQQNETAAQAGLNELRDRLEEIRTTELRTYFGVREWLQASLDSLSDDICATASNSLSHGQLLVIADKADCGVTFDLRDY